MRKVFGASFNPLDGEMGPYPLSDSMLADGEMGPYPLSDNTNLLGSSSFGIPLYRNYGSNYGTNYTTNSYVYPTTRIRYNSGGGDSQQCTLSNCSAAGGGGGGSRGSAQTCYYDGDCSRKKVQSKTPVPTRRRSSKRERDSFRRHSAHGRISSQGITSHHFIKSNDALLIQLEIYIYR